MGNLNFTFITDADGSSTLDMKVFCEPVVRTLATLGVKAEVNGRNDITIDGKKFSGNSQYLRQGRVMHHGTIKMCIRDSYDGESYIELKSGGKGVFCLGGEATDIKWSLESDGSLTLMRDGLESKCVLQDGCIMLGALWGNEVYIDVYKRQVYD